MTENVKTVEERLAEQEAKAAKLEAELGLLKGAPSPTGSALIPPNLVRLVLAIYGSVAATLMALVGVYPDSRGLQAALAIVLGLGTVFGLASPGMRKTTAAMVLAVVLVAGSGCSLFRVIGPRLLDCAGPSIQAVLPELVAQAASVLTGGKADWGKALEALKTKHGDAALCAVRVAVDQIHNEAKLDAGVRLGVVEQPRPVTPVSVVRGEAWLDLQDVQFAPPR